MADPRGAGPALADVRAARDRIAGVARRTPLRHSAALAAVVGGPVYLKLESAQHTGSFKLRGAASRLLAMDDAERRRGVVAVSSGNHGRAVAYVARHLGMPATICLSERVPSNKRDAIAALGARVVVAGPDQDDADAAARRLRDKEGLVFVHPFDDPLVIAGQGTAGLEILDDLPEVASVVVPVSGGGLIGGIALAMQSAPGEVEVLGVSQKRGPAMFETLRAGRLVDVVEEDTLADALAGSLGPDNRYTVALCRDLVREIVLMSEDEIGAAMAFALTEEGEAVEGGGAVGVAALLSGRLSPATPAVVVVSGGNVAPETLAAVVDRHRR